MLQSVKGEEVPQVVRGEPLLPEVQQLSDDPHSFIDGTRRDALSRVPLEQRSTTPSQLA